MQVMVPVSLVLLLAAAVVGIVSERRRDRFLSFSEAGTRIAIVLAAIAIVLIGSLAFAQRQVCTTLGGQWVSENQACRNEWGGNESNNQTFTWGDALDPRR
jgi:hypothetical protein